MRSLWLYGVVLLLVLCPQSLAAGKEGAAGLKSGVLFGMRLEKIAPSDNGTRVITTGTEFLLEKGGRIRCFQRIPQRREVARIVIPPGAVPLSLKGQTDFACLFSAPGMSLTLQGDSLVIIKADEDVKLTIQGLFKPAYQADQQGKWLFIDGQGGFGIYPTAEKKTPSPNVDARVWPIDYTMRKGEEIWISVFPPRPYNWKRAYEDPMAHEGNEPPYTYPSTELIESSEKYCKVMVVHSWYWPGGDRPPRKIPQFVPKNMKEFNISNAVGYWVYTGSTGKPGYVRQAPSREHIDAAIRNEVRIPRTEIGYEKNLGWEPNDGHLEFFDEYYYSELAKRRKKLHR